MGFSFVNILFPIITCTFAMETTFYGGSGGLFFPIIFDQGRITGITSWGYDTAYNGIIIESWTSQSKTNSDKIGTGTIAVACDPFSLSSNQYIDGVRVIYNNYVRRISFHISSGYSKTCSIDQTVYDTLTDLWDPELILIPGTYLTGFKFRYGSIIDAVGFEFTSWSPSAITITDMYGGNGGGPISSFDVGRIHAITNWGFSNDNPLNLYAVGIIDWISDQQSSTTSLGWDSWMDVDCAAFTLSSDEYIDGYRVQYSSFVKYIAFRITDGSTKVCAVSPLPSGLTDTGWNTVYHSQLTGLWAKTGAIIDQIVLQFTDVPLTCPSGSYQLGGITDNNDIWGCGLTACEERYDTNNIDQCRNKCASTVDCAAFTFTPKGGDEYHRDYKICTLYNSTQTDQTWGYQIFCILSTYDPTTSPTKHPTKYPTASPTKNPTISPTTNPSVSPTKYPTINPTISPTKNPTKNPTISPTKDPTKNPIVSPTLNPTISPTTSVPTAYPSKAPTAMPSTYAPTPRSGEIVEDETTANPLTHNTEDRGKNAAAAESNIFENEMFIFILLLSVIILLCFCIVCLCVMCLCRKNKDDISADLEKLRSVSMTSMNQINMNQLTTNETTAVHVGERKSVESNEVNDANFFHNFTLPHLPAPPPTMEETNTQQHVQNNFKDGTFTATSVEDGMVDVTGVEFDDVSTDSDDNLLYVPGNGGVANMQAVTAGHGAGNMHSVSAETGGVENV